MIVLLSVMNNTTEMCIKYSLGTGLADGEQESWLIYTPNSLAFKESYHECASTASALRKHLQ